MPQRKERCIFENMREMFGGVTGQERCTVRGSSASPVCCDILMLNWFGALTNHLHKYAVHNMHIICLWDRHR